MNRWIVKNLLIALISVLPIAFNAIAKEGTSNPDATIKKIRDCSAIADINWNKYECKRHNIEVRANNSKIFELHFKEYLTTGSASVLLNLIKEVSESIGLDTEDDKGNNYLHRLTHADSAQLIRALIAVGVSPDKRNTQRETPLMTTVRQGQLVNAGEMVTPTNINMRNEQGDTALHIAVRKRDLEMIDLLLGHKTSLFITNNSGLNPVDVAALHGEAFILDRLMANGGQINSGVIVYNDNTLWRILTLKNDRAVMRVLKKYYKKR